MTQLEKIRSLVQDKAETTVRLAREIWEYAELSDEETKSAGALIAALKAEGFEIKENDFMGIGDKTILAAGTDKKTVTLEMIDRMVDEDSAIVSIYFGSDSSEEEASEIAEAIEEKYPDVEVEINDGGQPIYYYVISVE